MCSLFVFWGSSGDLLGAKGGLLGVLWGALGRPKALPQVLPSWDPQIQISTSKNVNSSRAIALRSLNGVNSLGKLKPDVTVYQPA